MLPCKSYQANINQTLGILAISVEFAYLVAVSCGVQVSLQV